MNRESYSDASSETESEGDGYSVHPLPQAQASTSVLSSRPSTGSASGGAAPATATATAPGPSRLAPTAASSVPMSRVRSLQLQDAAEEPLPRPIVATGRGRNTPRSSSISSRTSSRASSRTATSSRSNSAGLNTAAATDGQATTSNTVVDPRRSPTNPIVNAAPIHDASHNTNTHPTTVGGQSSRLLPSHPTNRSSDPSTLPHITRANGAALPIPRPRQMAATILNTSADAYVVSSDSSTEAEEEEEEDQGFSVQSVRVQPCRRHLSALPSRAATATAAATASAAAGLGGSSTSAAGTSTSRSAPWNMHPSGDLLGRMEVEDAFEGNGTSAPAAAAAADAAGTDFRSPPPRLAGPATPVRLNRRSRLQASAAAPTASSTSADPIDVNLRPSSSLHSNPFRGGNSTGVRVASFGRTTSLPSSSSFGMQQPTTSVSSTSTSTTAPPRPPILRPPCVSPPRSKPPPLSHPLLSTYNCPICFDVPKPYAVVTPCGHLFCSDCIFSHLRHHAIKRMGVQLPGGGGFAPPGVSMDALNAVFLAAAAGRRGGIGMGMGMGMGMGGFVGVGNPDQMNGPQGTFFDGPGLEGADFEEEEEAASQGDGGSLDVAQGSSTSVSEGGGGLGGGGGRGGSGRGRGRGRGRGGGSSSASASASVNSRSSTSTKVQGPTGRDRNVNDPLRGPCPVCRSEIKGGLSGLRRKAVGLRIRLGKPRDEIEVEWEMERRERERKRRREMEEEEEGEGREKEGEATDGTIVLDASQDLGGSEMLVQGGRRARQGPSSEEQDAAKLTTSTTTKRRKKKTTTTRETIDIDGDEEDGPSNIGDVARSPVGDGVGSHQAPRARSTSTSLASSRNAAAVRTSSQSQSRRADVGPTTTTMSNRQQQQRVTTDDSIETPDQDGGHRGDLLVYVRIGHLAPSRRRAEQGADHSRETENSYTTRRDSETEMGTEREEADEVEEPRYVGGRLGGVRVRGSGTVRGSDSASTSGSASHSHSRPDELQSSPYTRRDDQDSQTSLRENSFGSTSSGDGDMGRTISSSSSSLALVSTSTSPGTSIGVSRALAGRRSLNTVAQGLGNRGDSKSSTYSVVE